MKPITSLVLPFIEGFSRPALRRGPRPAPRPPLRPGARFEERLFKNEAGERAYKLYVPSGYDGRAVPLIVMLHGCTQSPDDFALGTRMNEIAEEQNFLVAYPAQIKAANESKCWNWYRMGDQRHGAGEPALIAGLTRQIMSDYPIESGRVYIAGLSAGGAMAAIMSVCYPDLYAAAGIYAGLSCGAAYDLPSAFAAMKGHASFTAWTRPMRKNAMPTIIFHGDADKIVDSVNANRIVDEINFPMKLEKSVTRGSAGGIDYTLTIQLDENGRPLTEQWLLKGLGHAWSGGNPAGSYAEARGPDASREMVRFFLEHRIENCEAALADSDA